MSSAASSVNEPRSPEAGDMLPPLVLAPFIASAVFGLLFWNSNAAIIAGIGGMLTAFLVAWPLLFVMIDNARETAVVRTVIGIVCGIAPFAAAILSGIIGLYFRSTGFDYVSRVLESGASVPYYGAVAWPRLGQMVLTGIVCGVVTIWLSRMTSAMLDSAPHHGRGNPA